MSSEIPTPTPGPLPPSSLIPDKKARQRGRMGLTVSWEHIPWWGVIVMIVGVIVAYSVFTSARYQDALSFIFDLPWHKDVLKNISGTDIAPDGSWSFTVQPPLDTNTRYTVYAEFYNEDGSFNGRGDIYKFKIPKDAVAGEKAALLPSPTEVQTVLSTTPTFIGVAPAGTAKVVIIDDFRDQPIRILKRIWNANGVILTIKVTLISFLVAVVIGLIFGIMRVSSGSPDLRVNMWRRLLFGFIATALILTLRSQWQTPGAAIALLLGVEAFFFLLPAMPYTFSTLYVEIVRGVPMLVIILYMGFAVTPALRGVTNNAIDLRGLPAAVIGLAFGYGAYLAEVFRAGIEAIPAGQMEAARSIGMSYSQAMRFIILPQAIRLILPPLGNDFIAMLKDSSLISVIALPEVLQQGRLWISRNFRAFEGYNSVMMLYLVMTLLLSLLVRSIERRAQLPDD
ncbi:MAG: amino acid ABC transporter permease [Chloroflexi bacterium]|nr:amino acid ABC transporter permease [Chloroflexota bacterium]